MNLREGTLDALVDDGESVVQIEEYLTYLDIDFDRNQVLYLLQQLINENKIIVIHPIEDSNTKILNENEFEKYWFKLTVDGYKEWDKISCE